MYRAAALKQSCRIFIGQTPISVIAMWMQSSLQSGPAGGEDRKFEVHDNKANISERSASDIFG